VRAGLGTELCLYHRLGPSASALSCTKPVSVPECVLYKQLLFEWELTTWRQVQPCELAPSRCSIFFGWELTTWRQVPPSELAPLTTHLKPTAFNIVLKLVCRSLSPSSTPVPQFGGLWQPRFTMPDAPLMNLTFPEFIPLSTQALSSSK